MSYLWTAERGMPEHCIKDPNSLFHGCQCEVLSNRSGFVEVFFDHVIDADGCFYTGAWMFEPRQVEIQ